MKLRDMFGYEGQPHKIVFQPACISCFGEQEGDVFSKAKEKEAIKTVGAVPKVFGYTQ